MFGRDVAIGDITTLVAWLETAHFATEGEMIERGGHLVISVLDDVHGRVTHSGVRHELRARPVML